MLSSLNHIDVEAYARGRRCGRLIPWREDYYQAGMNVLLRLHYDRIIEHDLSKRLRYKLGYGFPQMCRYCLRGKPEVKFSSTAHAIPQALGNKYLISHDECDSCNNAFSSSFETQLDHFTLPLRALLGIRGKDDVPKYEKNGSMAWFERSRNCFVVIDRDGNPPILERDEANRHHVFRVHCREFSPLDVYRALVKVGFSLLEPPDLRRYGYLRNWLLTKEAEPGQLAGVYGVVYFSYNFIAAKHPRVCVWKRKRRGLPFPSLLVGITLPHLAFAFAMPPRMHDPLKPGTEMFLPRFDLSHQPGWTNSHWHEMDMREAAPKKGGMLTVVMGGRDESENVSDDDWFVGTGYSLERHQKRWDGTSPC